MPTPTASYDFSGTVALVAGASRGIGAATARHWAACGAAVALAARDEQALIGVADQIRADGGRALVVPTDLTQPDQVAALVDRTVAELGRLDFAFNNATAGPRPGPLTDLDVDQFDQAIAGNVRATFLGLKHEIPAILASGGGAIVNMSSGAGLNGVANLAAYVTGKAGIIGLSKVAALDYADQGLRVNVVAPGPILTHHLEAAGEEAQRQTARAIPMRRIGSVDDVSHAVLWLCSPAAGFVNGAVLPIDGGQSAGVKPPQMYRPGEPMKASQD